MASHVASGAAMQLASRAVHVKVFPPPRNIIESREVLRILRRFGEVAMFRSLRYDSRNPATDTILAVFNNPEPAAKLIAASPVQFTLELRPTIDPRSRHPLATLLYPETVEAIRIAKSEPNSNVSDNVSGGNSAAQQTQFQDFQLTVDASLKDHQTVIDRQLHHAGFIVNTKSHIQNDLARSVPCVGMSDFQLKAVDRPMHVVERDRDDIAKGNTLRSMWQQGLQDAGKISYEHNKEFSNS